MKAYFDCFSGISGDMTLGAFIDLGVPSGWLKESVSSLPLTGFDISVSTVTRNGIVAKSVRVLTDDNKSSRNWIAIKELIGKSPLPPAVVSNSIAIFEKIAVAEAEIHGCQKEDVHFHEIGGIDAIVDIVGTALCLEYLGITDVTASKIPLGTGFVQCEHGTLPVPVPATLAILKGISVYGSGISGELVTPTCAAIIASLADNFGPMPGMVVENTGYGAGTRDFGTLPNLLRINIGESGATSPHVDHDRVMVAETCIDDMNPELFGFLMDRLFEEGALDVCLIPVYMKKNRPGTLVQVLCPVDRTESIVGRLLAETASSGVRYHIADRTMLARQIVDIQTTYGKVQAKRIRNQSGGFRIVPEYEVCKRIAVERGIPIRVVYDTIHRETDPEVS